MTVLLVDDQISILSGLISGIDWNALNVTTIRTATSALQARGILKTENVDILLCDIEMPGENGLSLLRWARQQGYRFVCVFLTSHADFLYAKEAISLDCFDYILQPARYDDVQSTIARAISRVKSANAEKLLQAYGSVARNNSMGIFQSIFSDWSVGKGLSLPALYKVLEELGQEMRSTDQCFIIWGHLLSWTSEPWPTQEWRFAINNIVTEVYTTANCRILSFAIDYTSIGWFVYTSGSLPADSEILKPLHTAYEASSKYLPCNFAFYVSPLISPEQLNAQAKPLLHAKQNNVLHQKGIFTLSNRSRQTSSALSLHTEQFVRWNTFLENGAGQLVEEEILQVLDKAAATGQINRSMLHAFWIQFQQIVLNTLWKTGRKTDKFLAGLEKGGKAQSLQEIKAAVQDITAQFIQEADDLPDTKQAIVEKAKNYVEDHLDKSLNVNEVAASLFMNADYLSRLFKSETGMSLKEFIIKRKMETAQILLKTTALPISIIASKFGYDNFSYFSQAYRKVMGVSPTAERKEIT